MRLNLDSKQMKKKILFISFYYHPYQGVGSMRMLYWAKHLHEQDSAFDCDVVTATHQLKETNNIYYVEPVKFSFAYTFIKDKGVLWKRNLKKFLSTKLNEEFYEYTIISGSPFMHFGIAKYIKQRSNSKVITDFRDPFANNPRFSDTIIKRTIKRVLEKRFIKYADKVITVNRYCSDLLHESVKPKIHIIQNGFDEEIVDNAKDLRFDRSKIHLVYAGSFYEDRNPKWFLEALQESTICDRYIFHHIGKEAKLIEKFRGNSNIVEYGNTEYSTAIDIINSAQVGLLFTSGKEFESTTKIFDYIGCRKEIFIITNNHIKVGSMYDITKDLTSVHWIENSKQAIIEFLSTYQNNQTDAYGDITKFSRGHGLKALVNLLHEDLR